MHQVYATVCNSVNKLHQVYATACNRVNKLHQVYATFGKLQATFGKLHSEVEMQRLLGNRGVHVCV